MLTLTVIGLLVATPAFARIPAHQQAWQWRYRVWMPAIYQRIAWCESGSRPPADPVWRHHGGDYEGAFGFWYGSWLLFRYPGYPRHAYDATPWQQFRVAKLIHDRYGFSSPWGCYRHNAWVRG